MIKMLQYRSGKIFLSYFGFNFYIIMRPIIFLYQIFNKVIPEINVEP